MFQGKNYLNFFGLILMIGVIFSPTWFQYQHVQLSISLLYLYFVQQGYGNKSMGIDKL
jgi:hypothetical protein